MDIVMICTGCCFTYPSDTYEFVSWDDSIQYMENTKMFQTTNQCIHMDKSDCIMTPR